jgi:hypothetical protein
MQGQGRLPWSLQTGQGRSSVASWKARIVAMGCLRMFKASYLLNRPIRYLKTQLDPQIRHRSISSQLLGHPIL